MKNKQKKKNKKVVKKKVVKKKVAKKIAKKVVSTTIEDAQVIDNKLKRQNIKHMELAYQEKLEKMKKDIEVKAFNITGSFLHVKVGNQERPADKTDIEAVEKSLNEIFAANNVGCIAFVSHHAVEISVY